MDRGFTLLWRKTWDNPILKENNKVFSKLEAWLYLVNIQARGTDSDGILRGEMEVSYRFLARAWRWDVAKTYRFIQALIDQKMLENAPENTSKKVKHFLKHLKVCKYEVYNPMRNGKRNEVKEGFKRSNNKKLYIAEIVERIPTKNGIEFEVTEELVSEFKSAYPLLDIPDILKKIRIWAITNPSKQWTLKGTPRGINSWLSRDLEKVKAQVLFAGLANMGALK